MRIFILHGRLLHVLFENRYEVRIVTEAAKISRFGHGVRVEKRKRPGDAVLTQIFMHRHCHLLFEYAAKKGCADAKSLRNPFHGDILRVIFFNVGKCLRGAQRKAVAHQARGVQIQLAEQG